MGTLRDFLCTNNGDRYMVLVWLSSICCTLGYLIRGSSMWFGFCRLVVLVVGRFDGGWWVVLVVLVEQRVCGSITIVLEIEPLRDTKEGGPPNIVVGHAVYKHPKNPHTLEARSPQPPNTQLLYPLIKTVVVLEYSPPIYLVSIRSIPLWIMSTRGPTPLAKEAPIRLHHVELIDPDPQLAFGGLPVHPITGASGCTKQYLVPMGPPRNTLPTAGPLRRGAVRSPCRGYWVLGPGNAEADGHLLWGPYHYPSSNPVTNTNKGIPIPITHHLPTCGYIITIGDNRSHHRRLKPKSLGLWDQVPPINKCYILMRVALVEYSSTHQSLDIGFTYYKYPKVGRAIKAIHGIPYTLRAQLDDDEGLFTCICYLTSVDPRWMSMMGTEDAVYKGLLDPIPWVGDLVVVGSSMGIPKYPLSRDTGLKSTGTGYTKPPPHPPSVGKG
ncbi:hypothetical protein G9A89_000221 [Geosiphon pyriformis]|nr:hypothetical protein G9A89_000221 [Geosiphon pyriformis]